MHTLNKVIHIVYAVTFFLPYLHQLLVAVAKSFPATKTEIQEHWNKGMKDES